MARLLILSLAIMPLLLFAASKENMQPLQVVTEILPPYQYVTSDNTVVGLSTDKITTLFSELKISADIQVMPWARAYKMAQNRPNTLIYSIVRTPEREALFHWIGVLVSTKTFLVVLKEGRDIEIDSLSDLNRYRVGVKRDDVVYQYLRKHLQPRKMVLLPETETTLKMLIKQRIDIIAASPVHLDFMCKKLGCESSDFRYLYELKELNNDFYLAASKTTPTETVQRLRVALARLDNGE